MSTNDNLIAADGQTKIHPAANLFPMMDREPFEKLKADIAANGQRDMIVFLDDQILDGRNRWLACYELGIDPNTCQLDECESPLAYVASVNLYRRHLTGSQRATIGAELVPALEKEAADRQRTGKSADGVAGGRGKTLGKELPKVSSDAGKSVEKAAQLVGSNRESVRAARKLKAEAPKLFAEVKAGKTTIPAAKRKLAEADLPIYKCRNCGHDETDSDGDCAKCHDPAEPIVDRSQRLADLAKPYRDCVKALNEVRRTMAKLVESEATGAHLAAPWGRIKKALDDAKTPIAQATPAAWCPKCDGDGCAKCQKTGWLPKSVWDGLPEGEKS